MTSALKLDARAYALVDIHKAIYKFANRVSAVVHFCDESTDQIVVEFDPLPSFRGDIDQVKKDYMIELNDQLLRRQVRQETEDIRNVILALAFSKVSRS